jgi:hypothetical protein
MNMSAEDKWRAFANELAQLSLELCNAIPRDLAENQHLIVALLYARSHQSFQSAVLLAERGFNGDARTLVRSAVESAIAIAATGKDASFSDLLVEADQERRLKWIRALERHILVIVQNSDLVLLHWHPSRGY